MPAIKVYGRFWHLSGDDIPLFASFGAIFHCAWVVLIFISGNDIINMPEQCHNEGKQYIAVVSGLLFAFLSGFVLEVMLIAEGCRGSIFELSKRRRIPLFLTLRFINLIFELVFTAYGTYVVFGTQLHCRVSETIVFSPKKEIMILVILTWCFQVLTILNALLWYNMWPDVDVPERWENRFMWIGRYLCCQFRAYAGGKEKATKEYQESIRRIARWVNKVIGKLDLTPSDSALALVLVATLQRRGRREKIRTSLQAAKASKQGFTAISLIERASTVRTLPELNASSGYQAVPDARTRPSFDQDAVVELSPPDGGSPIFVRSDLTAGLMMRGVPAAQALAKSSAATRAKSQALTDQDFGIEEDPSSSQSEKTSLLGEDISVHAQPNDTEKGAETAPKSLESSQPLENFQRQMNLLHMSCITPSSMDEQIREDMPADEAVQLYTGGHWRVPADLLAEVEHFSRFAIGVYGFDMEVLKQRRWLKTLKKAFEWTRRKSSNQDTVNKSKMTLLYQQLFYQGVKEELGRSSELLYVSVQNQALSHLPYIIALDHTSRSVIVSVRGTWSMEDIVTDSVADPVLLKEWLPEDFRQANKDADHMWAHSGILGAANAILLDLEANGILNALLQGEDTTPQEQAMQRVASSGKASTPAQARQAAGHFVAAIMNRKLDCKGWQLMVTGHSLGAGAAALIALKLYGRFTDVKCWSFSPPGGLMSRNLSRAVQPFCTSVICGKDVVPRLSVVNIGRLIDQMVSALALCKHNKNSMLLKYLTTRWRHSRADKIFWDYDKVPKEALEVLREYSADVEARNRMIELVPPGHVIQLRPIKVQGERHHWDAVWVKAEEVIREGILVSPNMATDHYAMTLQAAIMSAQGYSDEEAGFHRYYPPAFTPPPEEEA